MIPTHAAAPDGPDPVALVGDLAVAPEDRQPDQRDERQRDRQADQRGPDEPGARIDDRVPRRDDEPDEDPDDARPPRRSQVGQSGRALP